MDLSPLTILRDAQKAVPAVKYALGIAGIAAAVAIVAGFRIDFRVAVFGTVIMFVLLFVLVVFSALASAAKSLLIIPALVAAWAFLILTVSSATLLMTSYFFWWPRSIEQYLPPSKNSGMYATHPAVGGYWDEAAFNAHIAFMPGGSISGTYYGHQLTGSWTPKSTESLVFSAAISDEKEGGIVQWESLMFASVEGDTMEIVWPTKQTKDYAVRRQEPK